MPAPSGRTTVIVAAVLASCVSIDLMLASIAGMMGQPLTKPGWSMIEAMTLNTDIGEFLHLTVIAHRQPGRESALPLLTVMHRFAPLGIVVIGRVAIIGMLSPMMMR